MGFIGQGGCYGVSVYSVLNVYAPNDGTERIAVFDQIKETLRQCDQEGCMVLGGDWNCTVDFTVDH